VFSGGRRWRRWREHREPGGLAIFAFHGVVLEPLTVPAFCFTPADAFRRQLRCIEQSHHVLPLDDALRALGENRLEGPTAALTFDDGFQSLHDLVLPFLRALGLPASCFLATAAVGSEALLWFCRLHRAVSQTPHPSLAWKGQRYDLSTTALRAQTSAQLQARLKKLPAPQLEREVDAIALALDDDPAAPPAADSPFRSLDHASITALEQSGLVRFGGHTHRHAILSALSSEAQREEIGTSLGLVREWVDDPLSIFAYPNGEASDVGPEAMEILRGQRISAALSAVHGRAQRSSPSLALPRICLGPDFFEDQIQ